MIKLYKYNQKNKFKKMYRGKKKINYKIIYI